MDKNFEQVEVFKGKSLADVFKDIYKNRKDKDEQINILINELRPLITNVGDAIQVIPLIRDYLDSSLRNNEHLIKLAAVVQRAVGGKTASVNPLSMDDDFTIPQHELDELKKQAADLLKNSQQSIQTQPTPNTSGSI